MPKVTQLENSRAEIQTQVLWLHTNLPSAPSWWVKRLSAHVLEGREEREPGREGTHLRNSSARPLSASAFRLHGVRIHLLGQVLDS